MNRGDIVLYKSNGAWYERAIVFVTHGPFVHTAIATNDHQVVAAGSQGIAYFPFSSQNSLCTVIPIVPTHTTPEGMERGMQWALSHVGNRYGWLDIVYQAVKFLSPNNPFQLVQRDHFDCSDFVSRYLQEAGVVLPPEFMDPYQNTPNDIGRVFSLITPRKG